MKKPEQLFNKVTDILVSTFPRKGLTTREDKEFKTKGILRESAFEKVVSGTDFISCEEFIKILEHLRIIIEFSASPDSQQEKRYFIPCVLNHIPESTTGGQMESEVMPLAVKFKCKHCPKGLFGVMITHLMSDSSTFQLKKEKIFRDEISLVACSFGVRDTISLKMYSSHFEIRFFPQLVEDSKERDTSVKDACVSIRKKVDESISKSIEDLHYNIGNVEPQMCLECPHCAELHLVEEGKTHKIHCDKDNIARRIPPRGRCWFNEGESARCGTCCY